jgi:basic membrane lipoprotein Med (substrate-binding protein (PBP1-ABC) superfamily)
MPPPRRLVLAALAAAVSARALPARAQGRLRVAALYTVPVSQPWVGRIHLALQAAAQRGDIDHSFKEGVAQADYAATLRQHAQQGFRLIVGESFGVEAAARQVARDFPTTVFLMASSGRPQAPNYNVFDNHIHEAAYLSGMVAGGMSARGRIGLVAGYAVPEVNRLMNAFMAGARDINPKLQCLVQFIDTWFDPAKARAAALGMVDQGADLLYAERPGVAEAAQERRVLAIGNVADLQAQFPDTVVTSALWHVEPTIDEAVKVVAAGTLWARDYGRLSSLRAKGCSLAPLGTFEGKVPAAVMDRVKARTAAIVAGAFVVRVDPNTPRSSPP